MTNPLEQIRAWRNVVTDQIVSMSGTRAISKEQMEELGRILAASQGYVCVPVEQSDAAKHWHALYRKECSLRQDDATRYGHMILDLEANLGASKETNRE